MWPYASIYRSKATESQQLLQCTNLVDKSGLNWGDGCIGASKKYLSCWHSGHDHLSSAGAGMY